MSECTEGKHGETAAECKMALISLQDTPPDILPYMLATGIPQTINHSNQWGAEVAEACISAASEAENTVVLNTSTDGVSCEVKWNYEQLLSYLQGKSSVLSMPDTNHNVKNLCYQLIGGSWAASIGSHVFDPMLLKLAGVKGELVCINIRRMHCLWLYAPTRTLKHFWVWNVHILGINWSVLTNSSTFFAIHKHLMSDHTIWCCNLIRWLHCH